MSNIPCFLIPVLVGLISALLGYLLGKLLGSGSGNLQPLLDLSNTENSKLSHKASLLENDLIVAKSSFQNELDTCKANSNKLNLTISSLQSELDLLKAKNNTVKSKSSEKTIKPATAPKKAVVKKAVPVKKIPAKKAPTSKINSLGSFDFADAQKAFGKKIKLDDLKVVEGIGPKIEELYKNAGIKTWKALSETPLEKSQAILDAAGDRYKIHNPGSWAKQALMASQGKWKELKEWQDAHKGGKE
jgi:predicted flap endonuclease-1-like 5' DNA nuclease